MSSFLSFRSSLAYLPASLHHLSPCTPRLLLLPLSKCQLGSTPVRTLRKRVPKGKGSKTKGRNPPPGRQSNDRREASNRTKKKLLKKERVDQYDKRGKNPRVVDELYPDEEDDDVEQEDELDDEEDEDVEIDEDQDDGTKVGYIVRSKNINKNEKVENKYQARRPLNPRKIDQPKTEIYEPKGTKKKKSDKSPVVQASSSPSPRQRTTALKETPPPPTFETTKQRKAWVAAQRSEFVESTRTGPQPLRQDMVEEEEEEEEEEELEYGRFPPQLRGISKFYPEGISEIVKKNQSKIGQGHQIPTSKDFKVVIHEKKEKYILSRHHWVYSNSSSLVPIQKKAPLSLPPSASDSPPITSLPENSIGSSTEELPSARGSTVINPKGPPPETYLPTVPPGHLVKVYAGGSQIGTAYYSEYPKFIKGRMVSFGKADPYQVLTENISRALRFRRTLFGPPSSSPTSSASSSVSASSSSSSSSTLPRNEDQSSSTPLPPSTTSLTTAYRLINAEGDAIPGLVVDRYNDILILQSSTAGIDMLKPYLITQLTNLDPSIKGIYEKSPHRAREEEGLKGEEGLLWGAVPDEEIIFENGLRFVTRLRAGPPASLMSLSSSSSSSSENSSDNPTSASSSILLPTGSIDIRGHPVDLKKIRGGGQKTGFYCDQRDMRKFIAGFAKDREVLDLFAYSGGFGIYALRGGAKSVHFVESSLTALELAQRNVKLNVDQYPHFQTDAATYTRGAVSRWLRTPEGKQKLATSNLVIIDPPAFAKSFKDTKDACKGYKDLNRIVIARVPPGSFILTCSCSYHVDSDLFQMVVFQAAAEVGRQVQIISKNIQAQDHPLNLFHREGQNYLKSLFLYVV